MSLRDEVTALLQELIRLDTVNPPGNETRAAEALQRYLRGNGVESRLVAKTPERANLVGNGLAVLQLATGDDDVCAALGERPDHLVAEAPRTAGDEGYLAGEVE